MISITTLDTRERGGYSRTKGSAAARWLSVVAAGLLLSPVAAAAQRATLTLEEAINIARQNNPTYRQTTNDATDADWGTREAYAGFLPSLALNNGYSYQASGTPRLGNLSAADFGLSQRPAVYSSDYRISLFMQVSGGTFFRARQARAFQKATEARIDAAGFDLATQVTRQYLAALRARDNVNLTQSAFERADEAFKLAEARAAAGDATRVDVGTAQVERGRQEVAVIQARNTYETEVLRLMQQLGVEVEADVDLTSTFDVFEPAWSLEELTDRAITSHPQLQSARRAEAAASAAAKAQWSNYLPTITLAGQWAGYVSQIGSNGYIIDQIKSSSAGKVENCQSNNELNARLTSPLPGYPKDCAALAYTDALGQQAVAANRQFPFNYTGSPAYFSASISLPIFDGFTREHQLQTARAQAEDAKYTRRAEELNRRTEVLTNLLALRTAYRTVQLEKTNAETAGEQLELAQEMYRLGAGSILELTQAQESKVRADQAQLAAIYTFHESLAALEAATGQPLRTTARPSDEDPAPRER